MISRSLYVAPFVHLLLATVPIYFRGSDLFALGCAWLRAGGQGSQQRRASFLEFVAGKPGRYDGWHATFSSSSPILFFFNHSLAPRLAGYLWWFRKLSALVEWYSLLWPRCFCYDLSAGTCYTRFGAVPCSVRPIDRYGHRLRCLRHSSVLTVDESAFICFG